MRPTPIHLPLALLGLAMGSALFVRPMMQGMRVSAQSLFLPISYPSTLLANTLKARLYPPQAVDVMSPDKPRTREALMRENQELHQRVATLEAQLEDLRHLSASYRDVGIDISRRSEPVLITGMSLDRSQSVTIATSGLSRPVQENMAVIHAGGVVGRVQSVGASAARVLLVTDPQSRLQCRFERVASAPDGSISRSPIALSKPLVEGAGRTMIVRFLPAPEVRSRLAPGDRVLLDDPLWPTLRGLQMGRVREIKLPPTDAGHAEVFVEPTIDFTTLREVRVVNK